VPPVKKVPKKIDRPNHDALLLFIGHRVRQLRDEQRLPATAVAEAARLSLRFYRDLENGHANIAVGRLAQVAEALDVPLEALVAQQDVLDARLLAIERRIARAAPSDRDDLMTSIERIVAGVSSPVIALLGLRGAGKSTIGARLAQALELEFIELDGRIEDAAGLALAEIFALHGEGYYRRLETRCLVDILTEGHRAVVALSGGIVHNDPAFELASRRCRTVWLSADPQDHMDRVIDQGDYRPMEDRDDAMAELRAMLKAREPYYRKADISVDTSRQSVDEVIEQLVGAL
jgi:XRE family aerobic/anaerobic benzoate catabolism transcriptional regulator